jgi:NADH:ubiquinone oxidoreductase subunit 6 (chain J)
MQTTVLILFALITALIIGSATMVVTVRNIIHSALWLITTFFGIGALFLLLEAEFAAVVQVLVYVGAVAVLVLFAIMLTRNVDGQGQALLFRRWWVALPICLLLFGAILVPTFVNQSWNSVLPVATAPGAPSNLAGSLEIGASFMREYLLPFEVVSILLLVALIGAIVIALEERERSRRVLTLAEEFALKSASAQAAPPEAIEASSAESTSEGKSE